MAIAMRFFIIALANKIITHERDEMLKDYILEMKISDYRLNMTLKVQ